MQVPDRGDFIYLDFDPQTGTEQAGGRRPAIVLSCSIEFIPNKKWGNYRQ